MPPPPSRHTFWSISRRPWATNLKLSKNLNAVAFKIKIYISYASTGTRRLPRFLVLFFVGTSVYSPYVFSPLKGMTPWLEFLVIFDIFAPWYYRKRGSASYIVREWLLWVVERERERETPVTSSISRWNREWSCIWLPRQRVDPMHMHTPRRVLSLQLLSSARSAWQSKTTNSNSCDRAVAQVNKIQKHIPEQPGWMNSKYWGNIEKRNQINTKNYWK